MSYWVKGRRYEGKTLTTEWNVSSVQPSLSIKSTHWSCGKCNENIHCSTCVNFYFKTYKTKSLCILMQERAFIFNSIVVMVDCIVAFILDRYLNIQAWRKSDDDCEMKMDEFLSIWNRFSWKSIQFKWTKHMICIQKREKTYGMTTRSYICGIDCCENVLSTSILTSIFLSSSW